MLRQNCGWTQFVRASVAHVMNRNLPPGSRRNNFSLRPQQFEQFVGSIVLF
jgi:hypothetical protein